MKLKLKYYAARIMTSLLPDKLVTIQWIQMLFRTSREGWNQTFLVSGIVSKVRQKTIALV